MTVSGVADIGIPLVRIDANLDEEAVAKSVIAAYEQTFGAAP